MVLTNKYTQNLIDNFKGFKSSQYLLDEVQLFERNKENINSHAVFTALTNYVAEELAKNNDLVSEEEASIYQFIEDFRVKYSEYPEDTPEGEIDNAICTCFLENLINRSSWGGFNFKRIMSYLGARSLEFCKEWDKFTDVRTLGLWKDKEWEDV